MAGSAILRIGYAKWLSNIAIAMGNDGLTNKIKTVAPLLTAGYDGGEDTLNKQAALGRMGSIV